MAALVRLVVQVEDYTLDPLGSGGSGADIDRKQDLLNVSALRTLKPLRAETITFSIYWSMLEVGIGLIASCIPSVHVFATTSSIRVVVTRLRKSLSFRSSSLRSPSRSFHRSHSASFYLITDDEKNRGITGRSPRDCEVPASDLEMMPQYPPRTFRPAGVPYGYNKQDHV